jgi:alpha-1,2-mannosyltransferase
MRKIADGFATRLPLIHSLVTERLTLTLTLFALAFVLVTYGYFALLLVQADGLYVSLGPMIGGDFVIFRTAGEAVGSSAMVTIYQMANLVATLREAYPGHGDWLVAWQYPPTMFLVVAPFALVPLVPGYFLWVGAFGTLFVNTLRQLTTDRRSLFLALACPAVLQAIITGQTGLFTASLIACSGLFASSRPILAGVAAGLLTIKLQYGILIPLAFLAAGCWRAIGAAAVTATVLAAVSLGAFGAEPWVAWVQAATEQGERMGGSVGYPLEKLVSPFGAARVLGIASATALKVQLAVTVLLAGYVVVVWRRVKEADLRLAALATAAVLAQPYALYYELVILVPPMLVVALRAARTGWLPYERLMLIGLWVAPLLTPGPRGVPAFPTSFAVAALAFGIAARRTARATAGATAG